MNRPLGFILVPVGLGLVPVGLGCGFDGALPPIGTLPASTGEVRTSATETGEELGSSSSGAEDGPFTTTGPAGETTLVAESSSSSGGGSSSTGEGLEPPPCPDPQMIHFPIDAPHNIGYDNASCGTGTCEVSCPDENANSDWNGGAGHHGIDLFAHYQAPLVAVADATVVAVGVVSDTSGLRVRIRDACGWEYYYGHLDEATVVAGQTVEPGDQLGTMGSTGTASVHLHFNVSFDGSYYDDIDPIDLLVATSATVC